MTQNIYKRAQENGCEFYATCVDVSRDEWDELMKGARPANKNRVIRVALQAGVIDEEQARTERKYPYYNPYTHYVTRTHIIYVHSCIEHFIKVN